MTTNKTFKQNLNKLLESMHENNDYFFIEHTTAALIMGNERALIYALDILQRRAALTADHFNRYSQDWRVYLIPRRAAEAAAAYSDYFKNNVSLLPVSA